MHGIIFERSAAELGTQPAGMMMMMMMMPGSASACDAPQPKRKKVSEPTASMKRRLAEHGDPRWPQEQCDSMTKKQLRQILRSHFDGFIASFRTSAEDGDVTASDTALPLPGVGGR